MGNISDEFYEITYLWSHNQFCLIRSRILGIQRLFIFIFFKKYINASRRFNQQLHQNIIKK